jgi:hypothetical protein
MAIAVLAALAASQLSVVIGETAIAYAGRTHMEILRAETVTRWCGMAVFGFIGTLAALEHRQAAFARSAVYVLVTLAAVAVVEAAAWASPFRQANEHELFVAIASTSIAAGLALLASRIEARRAQDAAASPSPAHLLPAWALLGLGAAIVMLGLAPFHTRQPVHDPAGWAWLPLHSEFPRAWLGWLADSTVTLARFTIGAYLIVAALARWFGRPPVACLFGVWAAVFAISEWLYARWTGRYADTLAAALALAALAWAVQTYRAIHGGDEAQAQVVPTPGERHRGSRRDRATAEPRRN